jgi:hypothetical protein
MTLDKLLQLSRYPLKRAAAAPPSTALDLARPTDGVLRARGGHGLLSI